jgi:hypothetical protein
VATVHAALSVLTDTDAQMNELRVAGDVAVEAIEILCSAPKTGAGQR